MKKKKKKLASAMVGDEEAGEGNPEDQADPLDNVNRDLEDDNLLHDELTDQVIEIPRNLTITQKEMAERKCLD